jgi:hypothetical protein
VSYEGEWKIGTCGRPMLGTQSIIAPGTGTQGSERYVLAVICLLIIQW